MKHLSFICGLLALTTLLMTTSSCREDAFDIRGEWDISIYVSNQYDSRLLIFSGELKQGSVTLKNVLSSGQYTSSGQTVHFNITYGASSPQFQENYSGSFSSENKMNGDYHVSYNNQVMSSGTWSGARR